jgi:hypothetical protein
MPERGRGYRTAQKPRVSIPVGLLTRIIVMLNSLNSAKAILVLAPRVEGALAYKRGSRLNGRLEPVVNAPSRDSLSCRTEVGVVFNAPDRPGGEEIMTPETCLLCEGRGLAPSGLYCKRCGGSGTVVPCPNCGTKGVCGVLFKGTCRICGGEGWVSPQASQNFVGGMLRQRDILNSLGRPHR